MTTARKHNSPVLKKLMDEITPEEMEKTKQEMINQINSKTFCPTCGSECKVEGNTTHFYVPVYTEKSIATLKQIIDEKLIALEDIAHGEIGDKITEIRKLLNEYKTKIK